jgi:hypothetical protein
VVKQAFGGKLHRLSYQPHHLQRLVYTLLQLPQKRPLNHYLGERDTLDQRALDTLEQRVLDPLEQRVLDPLEQRALDTLEQRVFERVLESVNELLSWSSCSAGTRSAAVCCRGEAYMKRMADIEMRGTDKIFGLPRPCPR